MKTLFITANGIEDAEYGGPKGSIRNYKALCQFGDTEVYTIKRRSTLKSILSILCGFYPPINNEDVRNLKLLQINDYDLVFFDGSIYGRLIELFPRSYKVVFYHNCEHDYNNVRFGNHFSLKKTIYQFLIDKNEKYITNHADYIITFSERDSDRLHKLYGRNANIVIPLGIDDKFVGLKENMEERFCLLLGGLCSANLEGYKWFVENVSPQLHCKTVIAGKGFEEYKEQWESDKVSVIGYVNNLEEIYANASCVAIPLLSGGGMKVKTVEALMFGKYIFGTDEAFSGFAGLPEDVAYRCNSAEEFVKAINGFISKNLGRFSEKSRNCYLNDYSIESAHNSFEKMIKSMKEE